MSGDCGAELSLLTQLVRQVIAEQATARDDMRVLLAIAMRQDATLANLLAEVRAMHG